MRVARSTLLTGVLAVLGAAGLSLPSGAGRDEAVPTVLEQPPASAAAAATAMGPLVLVGLGDSVPAASSCGCASYVTRYGAGLAARARATVVVHNLGVPGETTAGLLASLSAGQPAASAVEEAGFVTITIGANDFAGDAGAVAAGSCGGPDGLACAAPDLQALRPGLTAVVSRIDQLRAGQPTTVALTGYWALFQDGAVARQLFDAAALHRFDLLTRQVNATIAAVAGAEHAVYADLYLPFKGDAGQADDTGLLAGDGDHPSSAGHAVIAQALLAATPATH